MRSHWDKKREAEQEREANYFAMCLLMPEVLLRAEVKKIASGGFDVCNDPRIRALAKKFKVTEQLMILRLHQLGFLGEL